MATQAFRVKGTFLMGEKWTPFSLETTAADDVAARERVLSTIGSKHRAHRYQIKIESVKPIAAGEVTDPVVEFELQRGA